jgi:hypothetical protein
MGLFLKGMRLARRYEGNWHVALMLRMI